MGWFCPECNFTHPQQFENPTLCDTCKVKREFQDNVTRAMDAIEEAKCTCWADRLVSDCPQCGKFLIQSLADRLEVMLELTQKKIHKS